MWLFLTQTVTKPWHLFSLFSKAIWILPYLFSVILNLYSQNGLFVSHSQERLYWFRLSQTFTRLGTQDQDLMFCLIIANVYQDNVYLSKHNIRGTSCSSLGIVDGYYLMNIGVIINPWINNLRPNRSNQKSPPPSKQRLPRPSRPTKKSVANMPLRKRKKEERARSERLPVEAIRRRHLGTEKGRVARALTRAYRRHQLQDLWLGGSEDEAMV